MDRESVERVPPLMVASYFRAVCWRLCYAIAVQKKIAKVEMDLRYFGVSATILSEATGTKK